MQEAEHHITLNNVATLAVEFSPVNLPGRAGRDGLRDSLARGEHARHSAWLSANEAYRLLCLQKLAGQFACDGPAGAEHCVQSL